MDLHTKVPDRVDLVGSRVYLYTTFANLILCKRIAGAAWDTEHKAWSYPAAPGVARQIRATFPRALLSDAVTALANRQTGPREVVTAPPAQPERPTQPIPPPTVSTIPNLLTAAWKHQIMAYQFLQRVLPATGGGAMLAMGMGTGKSLTTIGALCNLGIDLALIVCPLRVVDVWPEQFRRHAGIPFRVLTLGEDAGTVARKTERASKAVELARARGERLAIVVNYESLWREPLAPWVLKQKWGLAICDESHRIKAPSGKASKFCALLSPRATFRLALTGTPMPHSPLDTFGQYRFLDRRLLGKSFFAFKQQYAVMGGFQQKQVVAYRNLEKLESLLATITFRVGKDVLDLPPETHVTYHCDLTPDGARVYKALEKDFVAEVKAGVVTAANAMVKLLRLQQITGGTVKTEDGRQAHVDESKQRLLEDTLEDIGTDRADGFEATGEPVVVFCRFHSDMDAVHNAAKAAGMTSMELSGRVDQLAEWQAGGAQVLAVQISAGGVGVDLTRARYNIYYSLSFSLGEYDQSLSRVHRPGQTRPVTHIHLVVRGTVDEKIIRALDARAEVIEAILQQIKEQGA